MTYNGDGDFDYSKYYVSEANKVFFERCLTTIRNYNNRFGKVRTKLELTLSPYLEMSLTACPRSFCDPVDFIGYLNHFVKKSIRDKVEPIKESLIAYNGNLEVDDKLKSISELVVSFGTDMFSLEHKSIAKLDLQYHKVQKMESKIELVSVSKQYNLPVTFTYIETEVGKTLRYGSIVLIDLDQDNRLTVVEKDRQVTISDSEERVASYAIKVIEENAHFNLIKNDDIDYRNRLKVFCQVKGYNYDEVETDEEFKITVEWMTLVTKDKTDEGKKNLFEKYLVYLGLHVNDGIESYSTLKKIRKFERKKHKKVTGFWESLDGGRTGYWSGSIPGDDKVYYGLTVYHMLTELSIYVDEFYEYGDFDKTCYNYVLCRDGVCFEISYESRLFNLSGIGLKYVDRDKYSELGEAFMKLHLKFRNKRKNKKGEWTKIFLKELMLLQDNYQLYDNFSVNDANYPVRDIT